MLNVRIRDALIRNATRIVRLGNATVRRMAPSWQRLSLQWAIDAQRIAEMRRHEPHYANAYAWSVINSGIGAMQEAVSILRRDMLQVGEAQHAATVRLLQREYARALEEQVSVVDFERGDAIQPMGEEMIAVVDNLDIVGSTLREFQDEQIVRRAGDLKVMFRRATAEGWRPARIVAEVVHIASLLKDHADKVARTGIMRISNDINERVYRANSDIVKEREYIATLDDRTCMVCGADDRRKFPLDSGPSLPRHVRCRCIYAPVTKSWREMGWKGPELSPRTRASMSGYQPGETTFAGWLKRQDTATQREVLGVKRYELFQQGTPIDRFVDDGRVLTLKALLGE